MRVVARLRGVAALRSVLRRHGRDPGSRRAEGAEVSGVRQVSCRRVLVIAPCRRVHLYSRPHIDLQRVAAALCCS
ncbi:putative leader peptide [Streptomyces sp. NPDC007983]|uniref:putative leader peptide n=1 Tax=Streptomyces sp. NPDC007983 TaxID=3364800 RepID=UPI0036E4F6B4